MRGGHWTSSKSFLHAAGLGLQCQLLLLLPLAELRVVVPRMKHRRFDIWHSGTAAYDYSFLRGGGGGVVVVSKRSRRYLHVVGILIFYGTVRPDQYCLYPNHATLHGAEHHFSAERAI
jgi:hypothetical protein